MLQTKMSFTHTLICVMSPSAGDCWYHIPSPCKQKLKQVSVGRTSVYTVDDNGKATAHLMYLILMLPGRLIVIVCLMVFFL